MGIETNAVRELQEQESPVEALFGQFKKRNKNFLPYPEDTEFRFFVGCLNDISQRQEYEALLTKSFQCQNNLSKPGDLAVLDMQGTFDKEGYYHVVSRYAILPEKAPLVAKNEHKLTPTDLPTD